MKYRREIDGLRALAVVPVILFHAGFGGFSGGFVGVDVFFVISGYLITTIIVSEQDRGTFTLAGFYERRVRRILPALFLVLAVSLPFAWLWLLPAAMRSFSQSLVAVSVFASNILFWRTSGYFDAAAELKPLLHTWSLAVEEQYYVFFPLLLMLAARLPRRWLVGALALAALASLTAAQIRVGVSPSATFYLLPTRGWELLIGALIAFYLMRAPRRELGHTLEQSLSAAGLALVVFAVLAFDRHTPFPGVYALVPTVGAGLIIVFARPATWTGRLLGSRAFVGVGLVSYSAYLWHQPIFALAREQAMAEPAPPVMAALAALSMALAVFSWKYVEAPFRTRERFSRRAVFRYGLAGSAIFALFGIAGIVTHGFPGRLDPEQTAYLAYFENSSPGWQYFTHEHILEKYRTECDFYDIPRYRNGYASRKPLASIPSACHERDPHLAHAVFIWGDSHAQQLYSGLREALPADWQILQVASFGCAPRLGARPDPEDYCHTANAFALAAIARAHPDVVIVGQNRGQVAAEMRQMGEALIAAGAGRVIFTGPTPHWTSDLPSIVVRKLWDKTPRRTFTGLDLAVLQEDAALKAALPQAGPMRYLSIVDDFCTADGCLVYLGNDRREGITSFDSGHLTPMASAVFARNILAAVVTGEATGEGRPAARSMVAVPQGALIPGNRASGH